MSDIKWIKINTNMFEDEKIRLIDAMPERDTIHYVWVRLLVQAGKTNAKGFIFLSENIPYTEEMLSTIFSRPINSIRLSLTVLRDFGMIEIDNENRIKIAKWEKHQNVEGMDKIREQTKKRVEKCRERKKLLSSNVTDDRCNATVTKQNKIKKENKEIEKDIDTEKEVYVERDRGIEEETHTDSQVEGILNYYSNVADEIFGFDFKAVKIAVATYGEKYVRLAINRALEVNKPNIMYINGILRNWKRIGYPEENESKSGFYKKDSNDNYYNKNKDYKKDNSNYKKENSYNKNNNYRTFNNFPPREYDYDKLEKSLLGWN